MYIDIEDNDNLDEPCMATFAATGAGRPVSRLRLWHEGDWRWCAVCGWSEGGPTDAHITPIEESGDGPALLVSGGDWGLRLAELTQAEDPEPRWDLEDAGQWAEGFLICRPDLQHR